MPHLVKHFRLLSQHTEELQARLNNIRDSLRDMLSADDRDRFPPRGPHAISVFDVLDAVYGPSSIEEVADILRSRCFQSQLPEPVGSHPLGRYAHRSNLQFLRTLCRFDTAEGGISGSTVSF